MNRNFNLNLQLFGEGAEENAISAQQLVKAREVDFVTRFEGGVMKDLMDALGVARKVPMMEGTVRLGRYDRFTMDLPHNRAFRDASLQQASQDEIAQIEQGK